MTPGSVSAEHAAQEVHTARTALMRVLTVGSRPYKTTRKRPPIPPTGFRHSDSAAHCGSDFARMDQFMHMKWGIVPNART